MLSLPRVKCCALLGSGLRLKANRVRGFRESGDKVRGERNPKIQSTYFWGGRPPIYTSSKLPSCKNDYKSKPSKNPPEHSFLLLESSSVFHSFPPNSYQYSSGTFWYLPSISNLHSQVLCRDITFHVCVYPVHDSLWDDEIHQQQTEERDKELSWCEGSLGSEDWRCCHRRC